jgi:malate dehydrogenase (oxaloacetate-decarboxylating)
MNYAERALEAHAKWHGKFEITSRAPLVTREDLSIAYTPGVAAPCLKIRENPADVDLYTRHANIVAVITDGSAVLGLGNIGAHAAMPVMEGKAILFKEFADIDAIPLCLDTQDEDAIIAAVKAFSPSFGGINLEDISAPRCFTIENALIDALDIPVFHDDQHGTAIVTLAAVINALRITDKKLSELRIIMNGAGAAGIAITKLLNSCGAQNVVLLDSKGVIAHSRNDLTHVKKEMLDSTNPENISGSLADAMRGADVFIGVSVANVVTRQMVQSMSAEPIILAMANPTPEILPQEAIAAGARIVGTGRSDFPNQVNNVLGFPGIFRGALDVRARCITENMKIAAAHALADAVPKNELCEEKIIPSPLDKSVVPKVAAAVRKAADEAGVARI